MLTSFLALLIVALAFAAGFSLARRPSLVEGARAFVIPRVRLLIRRVTAHAAPPIESAEVEAPAEPPLSTSRALVLAEIPIVPSSIRFEPVASRGTQSADLSLHTPEWKERMARVGDRFADAGVCGIVFVHGTFMGSDPLSAYGMMARALPSRIGPYLARTLRRKTRGYIGRVLGDIGNFGTEYVRLFEEAIRPAGALTRIPCTDFVWSSENHHVGRLEGALGLVRTLATHAELDGRSRPRLLVIGHSHAGQLFALVTQLLARSIAAEAILDIARARELDVAALETDLATLEGCGVDFVTFGAPARYAWATLAGVRALHVIAVPPDGARAGMEGDWIRRLGVAGSDFPPLGVEDRRVNAVLADSLGPGGFAPSRVASALRAGLGLPSNGDVALVEYGERGFSGFVSTGLGHGSYTRLDAMLFHARLIGDRLYPAAVLVPATGARRASVASRHS
jgi:hypothetical protein